MMQGVCDEIIEARHSWTDLGLLLEITQFIGVFGPCLRKKLRKNDNYTYINTRKVALFILCIVMETCVQSLIQSASTGKKNKNKNKNKKPVPVPQINRLMDSIA